MKPLLPPSTAVDNVRGGAWMVGSTFMFATAAVAVKLIGNALPVQEVAFFRCLFGLSVILPFLWRYGLAVFRTTRPDLHITRVLCATMSLIFGFYALANLDLATATALSFTRPLFMILLAVAFLGEVVRWRRGLATLIGFLGVVIMLGPERLSGGMTIDLAFGSALLAALFVSGAIVIIKHQAAVDGPVTIMFWWATGTALLTAIPAAVVWVTPTPEQWTLLVYLGVSSSLGQFCMIKAFTYGEATVMNPIDYGQLILAALFGFLFFNELPQLWTWAGAAVIVASTLYILFREAAVKNEPPPPPVKE